MRVTHQSVLADPTGQVLMSFDANVSALLTGWMGMNKVIHSSANVSTDSEVQVCYQPVPFPYVHTLHWFLMVWLATLPLVLVDKVSVAACSDVVTILCFSLGCTLYPLWASYPVR